MYLKKNKKCEVRCECNKSHFHNRGKIKNDPLIISEEEMQRKKGRGKNKK